MRSRMRARAAILLAPGLVTLSLAWVGAQRGGPPVPIDQDDIGGVVTSAKGPEAGVWVVAETTDLPTKFARIVVTDDQGRYVMPDLPIASYQVFVRGYGLVDSPRHTARPGQQLNLLADVAPDAKAAAQVYPAAWWLAMVPAPDDLALQKKFTMDMKECYANSVYHANESYLTHVDTHDTLGLGRDAPMYGSVNTDAIEVLSPSTKRFVTLRVPYPMGFFPRSANGRIDNPATGWKGKGLWADYASYAGCHIEGGKGTLPKAVKFQVRPTPLAK